MHAAWLAQLPAELALGCVAGLFAGAAIALHGGAGTLPATVVALPQPTAMHSLHATNMHEMSTEAVELVSDANS